MKQWRNWSGSVTFTPTTIHYPHTLEKIQELVRDCQANNRHLRVVGAGHSFTALVATDYALLSLDNYAGIEKVDHENCIVTVRAGTKIKALGELLFEHGLAQENLGDIDVQSIGGAISTGTHGTGINFGNLSTQVIGLTLVTGDGNLLECSETHQREIFKAAQVSLGALGVIVSVTLSVMPTYALKIETRKKTLSDCLENLEAYKQGNRHFEFHWIPYTDYVQAKFTNTTNETPNAKSRSRQFNELVIENGALWLFSTFNRQFPASNERLCRLMTKFISDVTDVSHAHQMFASTRLVKFQEMEYNIPAAHFAEVIQEIDTTIRRQKTKVHFPIECRFAHSDDIYLSPAFGRESAYIAVHMFKGMEYQSYFDAMEAIFTKYNGRPHWGKMHTRTAGELSQLYPHWEDFKAVRNQTDPKRVFANPYLEKILG